jgi:hypothetical protein
MDQNYDKYVDRILDVSKHLLRNTPGDKLDFSVVAAALNMATMLVNQSYDIANSYFAKRKEP